MHNTHVVHSRSVHLLILCTVCDTGLGLLNGVFGLQLMYDATNDARPCAFLEANLRHHVCENLHDPRFKALFSDSLWSYADGELLALALESSPRHISPGHLLPRISRSLTGALLAALARVPDAASRLVVVRGAPPLHLTVRCPSWKHGSDIACAWKRLAPPSNTSGLSGREARNAQRDAQCSLRVENTPAFAPLGELEGG